MMKKQYIAPVIRVVNMMSRDGILDMDIRSGNVDQQYVREERDFDTDMGGDGGKVPVPTDLWEGAW